MSLATGARLGPYEVAAPLGAGGMGEVYRARDTKLGRDVALKILPDAFASDHERVARFEREARTLAALNHPHIAQIHGFEHLEGTSALVMELVEGETLAGRIARGPVPLDEALPIARQMADALEAAHEQGIVHRDFKPANVKVRPDGAVKVLDFGLAKAAGAGPASAIGAAGVRLDQSPTITSPSLTMQGMLLGTAAYMSPEQAKGRPADRRSDIWAFGCVLYEMLTARRAFDGDDVSDTLALVLKGQPDWTALPAATPSAIATLIRRCLERDPRRRLASMSTVCFLLDESASLSGSSDEARREPDPAAVRAAVDAAVGRARRLLIRTRLLPLAIVTIVSAAAAIVQWQFPPSGRTTTVARFSISLDVTDAIAATARQAVAISADGTRLAYLGASGRLFLRSVSDWEAHAVADNEGRLGLSSGPAFSPDNRALAFYEANEGALRRIAVAGGASVRVCPADPPFGLSWSATGILVGQGSKGVVRCTASGAAPEQLVAVNEGEEAHGPRMLPDGQTILLTVARTADGPARWDKARIVVHSLPSGSQRTVLEGGSDARYLPTGHLVYALDGVVFAVPFNVARQEVTGEPMAVLEGVRRSFFGATGTAHFAVSASGTLLYVPGPATTSAGELALAVADRAGDVTLLPTPSGPYVHTRASPDGTRLAIGSDNGREAIVWILPLRGEVPIRRLTLEGRNRFPIWSPDGQRIAFQSDRGGDRAIYSQRVDGSGVAERLTVAGQNEAHIPESWSPDGAHLSFAVARGAGYSLAMLSLRDKRVTPFGGVQSREPIGSVFSPDGKWVAYASSPRTGGGRSPDRGIFLQPFPATGEVFQAPKQELDFHPAWGRNGAELVFVPSASSGRLAILGVGTRPALTFTTPVTVPQEVMADRTSGTFRAWDILPDGRFVGLASAAGRLSSTEIRVVLNWFEELKQKVPVR